jgi:uncharacterized protein
LHRIATPARELLHQQATLAGVRARAVRRWLGENFYGTTRNIHREQAEPEETAQAVGAAIAVAAPPRGCNGEPDLIGQGEPIDRLQYKLQRERQLEFADDYQRRLARAERHDVAATDLALHLEPEPFEKRLHRRIQRHLGHAGSPLPQRMLKQIHTSPRQEQRRPMPANPVYRRKPNAIEQIFGRRRAVIGVIHSRPLPGAPDYDGEPMAELVGFAVAEAARYRDGGVDGLIVENHGDIPFAKPGDLGPETAACMAVMTQAVRQATGLPVGVNVLANGAVMALAVAKAAGAAFVRVNQWANAYVANEGFMEGRAGEAARYRAWLRARDVRVFADVHVKHGAHAVTADRTVAELARDVEFFDADVAIATGQRTGDAATAEELRTIADGTSLPVAVGSGVTPANIGDIFTVADAVIVASWLKHDGVWWNPVDPQRLRVFMEAVKQARE